MTFCAQYGNSLSYYGNIEYGVFLPTRVIAAAPAYGAWPEDKPAQEGMLVSDWQEPVETKAAEQVALIRLLRAELREQQDTERRIELRKQLEEARRAKVKAFQLAARIDEEESFLILH